MQQISFLDLTFQIVIIYSTNLLNFFIYYLIVKVNQNKTGF
jgi:hypothetical protein